MKKKLKRRAFAVNIPKDEAQAVLDEAKRMNVSITLLFRMWVRETLMKDPIKFIEKV